MQSHGQPYLIDFSRSGAKVKVVLAYDFTDNFVIYDPDSGYLDGNLKLKLGTTTVAKNVDGEYTNHQTVSNTLTLAAGQFGKGTVTIVDDTAEKKLSGSFNIAYFTKATTYSGTSGANYILGSTGADVLKGNGGNDALSGDSGNDKLYGGSGNDTLSGGKGIDYLYGAAGKDVLIGGAEKDHLDGGAGNDTYVFKNKGTLLSDSAGVDTIKVAFSYTLKAAFENLVILGTHGATATGNEKANEITCDDAFGNNGSVFRGLGGNDTLSGSGSDKLYGGAGNDILDGSYYGHDLLDGGAGNDKIYAFGARFEVSGGDGDDIIAARIRNSSEISGGAGKDSFSFDIETGASQKIVITDFAEGTEKIDLSAIDADTINDVDLDFPEDQAFRFIGTASFSFATGELRYFQTGTGASARTIIEGDTDGDKTADFQIELTGLKTLHVGDFVL